MSTLQKGLIGNILTSRLYVVSEFEKKLNEISEREEKAITQLESTTPPNLWVWLKEECVISNLVKGGKSSTQIYFNHAIFGDLNSVQEQFIALQKAWDGCVLIRLDEKSEPKRIGVHFSAVMS